MAYTKNTPWVNGDPTRPLNQSRLNHVEDGLFLAAATADSAAAAALAAQGDATSALDIAGAAQVAADLDADTGTLVSTPGTAVHDALSATITSTIADVAMPLSDVLEMQPIWVSGHSWQALDTNATPGTRWYQRLASRFRMGGATNKAVSGRTIGDICNLTLGGNNAWVPRTKALVGLICTINDITLFDGSAASLRGYQHAWRSMLALLTANGLVAANTTSFVFSSGWSSEAVTGTSGSAQGATVNSTGGTRWKTTTVGEYFEFTFTGTECDAFLVARAAGAGLVTFKEGATTLGTLDLTATTAQDCAAIFRVRGLASGTHTIRGTLTSGASLTVDSYRIPSTAPAPIIVCGEPEVIPTGTDHSTYWADVQTFKAALASICTEYPSVVYVDLDQADWDTETMLVTDSNGGHKHPNDKGCAYIATKVTAALTADLNFTRGLNITESPTGYPAAYTPPAGPSIPAGGVDGTSGSGTTIPHVIAEDFISRYAGSNVPGSAGAAITAVTDVGTAAVNLSGTNGPTLRTSPFKYLEFDGVNDALSRAATPSAVSTHVLVARIRTLAPGSSQVIYCGNGSANQNIGKASAGNWIANNGSVLDAGIAATEQWVVLGVVFNGASSKISINGGAPVTGAGGSNATATSSYLGRAGSTATFYPVDVADHIIYNRALTDTELRGAALQLIDNYGL